MSPSRPDLVEDMKEFSVSSVHMCGGMVYKVPRRRERRRGGGVDAGAASGSASSAEVEDAN